MSQDSIQAPPLARNKCPSCGLVNAGSDEVCRRCGIALFETDFVEPYHAELPPPAKPKKRPFVKRVIWIATTTGILLIAFYTSLLLSSDGLTADQREKVQKAIALLNERGLSREAFVLNRLASFRSSDNWLNAYVGHRDAYAATNFPFEIVTLYPEFFEVPADDCERAAVLLHEARHMFGEGEDAALENTWKSKRQLGWTIDKYGGTRVWDATMRLTKARFPYMFQCGGDGQTDCL
jgi:hypothetical protein